MSQQVLLVKCLGCKQELDSGFFGTRKYHPECYLIHRRYLSKMRARRKLLERGQRNCKRCGGKLGLHKKNYCSPYCRWLNDLKNWNPMIKKQLELLQ